MLIVRSAAAWRADISAVASSGMKSPSVMIPRCLMIDAASCHEPPVSIVRAVTPLVVVALTPELVVIFANQSQKVMYDSE
jgi:hypothetical protein